MLLTGRDASSSGGTSTDDTDGSAASPSSRSMRAVPSDQEICQVLRQVQLGPLLDRVSRDAGAGLDTSADWASMLSLGEQQRLAFARYCTCRVRSVSQRFHSHWGPASPFDLFASFHQQTKQTKWQHRQT